MRRDEGNTTVLAIGLLLVLGLLTVVVVNASAAFLERRDLMNLADRAALTAADGLARDQLYLGGDAGSTIVLDLREASALTRSVVPFDTGVDVVVQGDMVTVRLDRRYVLPLRPPGWNGEVDIAAESTAQLRFAGP
ncbi:hypothetical protein JL108_06815 [Aeromicrobium sp. YIM 150415]|uniref:pilus assembly protein TadG-related protein n=1 Tax=Aeromicrobium sp. YIM 150415 TaxID=2803912 RepID=UPI00196282EB|nr:pilus assembly protein TadG-related protein [Aeromicrobium sp. YIM 150415]MBM9461808.1 hypothetical protein [Aeromicrobium sp. YIM 150415]MBM9463156.1 hypothetical protein [Aeromicrobium sp. YIM 150415]